MRQAPQSPNVGQNNKHSSKISWYRRNAVEMINAIDDYLDRYDITLPRFYPEYKAKKETILKYPDYGPDIEQELGKLIKMRYDLCRSGKAVYALFQQQGKPAKTQILACQYSKHRLDPVWNYRKSQLIRKIYRQYLQKSDIHNQYLAAHLTLTVPHPEGLYRGRLFYAREIIAAFNLLRKSPAWKKYVYAGEYGVEIKKGNGQNGLHIHIHSLVFQHPCYTINQAREAILTEWKAITGATFIHYQTLYFFKRKPNGQFEQELRCLWDEKTGDYRNIWVKKKFYIDRPDRPADQTQRLQEYLHGVMECIKYHFKNDAIKKAGSYDCDLIVDILNNAKGMRLYSRYGAFYREKELNFNRLQTEHTRQSEEEIQEEIMGSVEGVQILNPYSGELAMPGEYKYVIGKPETLKHRPKNDPDPYAPALYSVRSFLEVREGFGLKEILKKLFRDRLEEILTWASFQKYLREQLAQSEPGRQAKAFLN